MEGIATDLQRALVNMTYAYFAKPGIPETPLELVLAGKFEHLEAFLSKTKWVVGDQITYVDFYLYEVLHQFTKFKREFLKPYPSLVKYMETFESLPQLSEYIKDSNHLICFCPFAPMKF